MLEFKKVSSIKRVQKKTRVFNFSVPTYETYIANGFVVHNCQNHQISQDMEGRHRYLPPEQLIETAVAKEVTGIAFSYNEPTIYYEYLMDVGKALLGGKFDFPLAVKTNGFVTEDVLSDLCTVVEAWNVDLKGDEAEYESICGGYLTPVKQCIEYLYSVGKHIEISYLVTPRLIHDYDHHQRMLAWLSQMPDIPVHLLYFYPGHHMGGLSYPPEDLLFLVREFKKSLEYVYASNVFHAALIKFRNTHCPVCHSLMVDRTSGVKIHKTVCCDKVLLQGK